MAPRRVPTAPVCSRSSPGTTPAITERFSSSLVSPRGASRAGAGPWRVAASRVRSRGTCRATRIRSALRGARTAFAGARRRVRRGRAACGDPIRRPDACRCWTARRAWPVHRQRRLRDLVADPEQREDPCRSAARAPAPTSRRCGRGDPRGIREEFFRSAGRNPDLSVYSDAWPADEPFMNATAAGQRHGGGEPRSCPPCSAGEAVSDNGLPVGAPPFSEATLLAIGEEFQAATAFPV